MAGYSGTITGDDENPYYEGSCTAVQCPSGSAGVADGCMVVPHGTGWGHSSLAIAKLVNIAMS